MRYDDYAPRRNGEADYDDDFDDDPLSASRGERRSERRRRRHAGVYEEDRRDERYDEARYDDRRYPDDPPAREPEPDRGYARGRPPFDEDDDRADRYDQGRDRYGRPVREREADERRGPRAGARDVIIRPEASSGGGTGVGRILARAIFLTAVGMALIIAVGGIARWIALSTPAPTDRAADVIYAIPEIAMRAPGDTINALLNSGGTVLFQWPAAAVFIAAMALALACASGLRGGGAGFLYWLLAWVLAAAIATSGIVLLALMSTISAEGAIENYVYSTDDRLAIGGVPAVAAIVMLMAVRWMRARGLARARRSAATERAAPQPVGRSDTSRSDTSRSGAARDEAPRAQRPRSEAPRSEPPRAEPPRSDPPRRAARSADPSPAPAQTREPTKPVSVASWDDFLDRASRPSAPAPLGTAQVPYRRRGRRD